MSDENVSIVFGTAGCGKSVIMRDILIRCKDQNIPALGLKSDMQKSTTIKGLTDSVNLSTPIIDALRQVAHENIRTVLIIDQIDALSQYLSANREYINVYTQIVRSLKSNDSVRIIISTREFDLKNDPTIQSLKSKSRVFNIKELSDDQVNKVLGEIGDRKSVV